MSSGRLIQVYVNPKGDTYYEDVSPKTYCRWIVPIPDEFGHTLTRSLASFLIDRGGLMSYALGVL